MKLSELFLNRFLYKDTLQNLETKDSVYNSGNVNAATSSAVPSGGAAQDINTGNVQINGAQLEPGTYPVTVLDVSNWGWGQTCAFSSTDLNTVSWGAGTFTSADGTSYAIAAGNTGNMAAKTYIYLSLLDSTTAYQITTTPSTSVGIGKVLVAVANPDTAAATYNLSEATQIVGDNILANSINASKITTGQLIVGTNVGLGTAQDSAGVTTIVGNTITTSYVNALNITALGTVTTGTLTGVLIQTSASANTGVKISSAIGGINVYGTDSFNVRDSSGTLYGSIGGYGGYFNINAVSGRNMLIGADNASVIFANDVATAIAGGGLLGSSSAPWNSIYGGNIVSNNYYDSGGNQRLYYSSSKWQSSTDFKVNGSINLTGNLVFDNSASITINGTAFYVTADPDAPGKYYLRS